MEPLSWSTPREAVKVFTHHIGKTMRVALLVGTILFVINQLDVVLRGQATASVWIKGGITYLVPFVVSNVGLLLGTRRTR
jgi:hypothetical protein